MFELNHALVYLHQNIRTGSQLNALCRYSVDRYLSRVVVKAANEDRGEAKWMQAAAGRLVLARRAVTDSLGGSGFGQKILE